MGRPRDATRASRMRSRGGGVARGRAPVALFLLLAALAPPAVAPLEVDTARMTPEERRAVLERAFPGVFPDARAGDGSVDAEGGARAGAGGVPSIPRGRLGAVGEPHERDRALERWVREPLSAPYAGAADDDEPFVGPVGVRSVFGRGRGLVTAARVEKGETLMSLPLLKCLSTASARRSPALAPALAELAANRTEMSINAVLALHLLHELHVVGDRSHWWPYVSVLPKDVGSPLLWAPKELAQLEGSNLVGFRDAVLRGWIAERDALFPELSRAFPDAFPEEHFRASNWAWAMSIVWSRAAHVPVAGTTRSPPRNSKASKASNAKTILALVPLFDMINHGYARGTGIGSRHAADDAPAVTISFVESRGAVVVSAGVPFRGPGEEIRFNYGEKPSQYAFLQYGFVPRFNPDECVEVAPRMGKKDPLRRRKREVLAKHGLSPSARNFHFFPNRLDRDLLAATRVQVATEAELDDPRAVAAAVAGGVVSARNEAVTRATLLKAAHELLLRYPTSLAQDLATMEAFLDQNPYDPALGAETPSYFRRDENTYSSSAADSRYRAAVAMRVLEKRTLLSAARLLVHELDDALAEETCRERYARTREETRECLARASGEAFDAFDARETAEDAAAEDDAAEDAAARNGGERSGDGVGNGRSDNSTPRARSARGDEL